MKFARTSAWAASMTLGLAAATHAATVADFNFNSLTQGLRETALVGGSATDPITNSAAPISGVTVSNLSASTKLKLITTDESIDATPTSLASMALGYSGSDNKTTTPDATKWYVSFTVSNGSASALALDLFSYQFGAGVALSGSQGGLDTSAQLFYDVNHGGTFTSVGNTATRSRLVATGFSGLSPETINLTTIPDLNPGDSIEFRLALSWNSSYGFDNGQVDRRKTGYLDDLKLTAVPEPASLGLILPGLLLLARRRRG